MCDLSILYLNLTSAVTVGDESCGLIQYLEIKDSTKKFNSENPQNLILTQNGPYYQLRSSAIPSTKKYLNT